MAFESDADRLALISSLGGVVFIGPRGNLQAIFERAAVATGDLSVISTTPQLAARSIDVERCALEAGSLVRGPEGTFLVREIRHDGTGMAAIDLETP
jgi:hypothetical protein